MSSSHANTLCHINTKENLVCFLKTLREGKVTKTRIDDPLNNRLQERTITFVHYKLYLIVARSWGRVREMDVYFLIQEVAVMNTCVVTTAVAEVRFPGTFFQKKLWRNFLLARGKKKCFLQCCLHNVSYGGCSVCGRKPLLLQQLQKNPYLFETKHKSSGNTVWSFVMYFFLSVMRAV